MPDLFTFRKIRSSQTSLIWPKLSKNREVSSLSSRWLVQVLLLEDLDVEIVKTNGQV